MLLNREVHSKALSYAPWLTCPGSWQQCRIREDVFLPSSFFKSWGWWEWLQERGLFYSGLVESISGGSLVWAWPEVWALTPTRGRSQEQAQGKGRKSHLCDTMARARLLSRWPPFHHLALDHVTRTHDGGECSCDLVNVWPCVWLTKTKRFLWKGKSSSWLGTTFHRESNWRSLNRTFLGVSLKEGQGGGTLRVHDGNFFG